MIVLPVRPKITLGPPGTGKTTFMINKVEEFLERGIPPDHIGFVTFTRRGAEEAQKRALTKFNLKRGDLPWFRTLHSLCLYSLGVNSGAILDGSRLQEFGEMVGERITGRFSVTTAEIVCSLWTTLLECAVFH